MSQSNSNWNDQRRPGERSEGSTPSPSRRKFIKKAGTAGLAVPVFTTVSGTELLTRSALAETPGDDSYNDYGGGLT